jgi:hypothetical protein
VKPCQIGQQIASPWKRFAPSLKTRSLEWFHRGEALPFAAYLEASKRTPVELEVGGRGGGRGGNAVEVRERRGRRLAPPRRLRWARPEAGAPEAAGSELLSSRVHGDKHGAKEATAGEIGDVRCGGGRGGRGRGCLGSPTLAQDAVGGGS